MNKFIDFTVEKIRFDFKTGLIAPLTSHGTLLVNNIHASCYAEINSHLVADWAVTPIKYWYKLRKYLMLNIILNELLYLLYRSKNFMKSPLLAL
jgi:hypothetical protein